MSPGGFIDELLLKANMREARCGFNYRFGHKASGDVGTLTGEGERKRFGVHVMEPVVVDGTTVSSSLIRDLLERGEVGECAKLLGRRYAVSGRVAVGNRLGKSIGFPTSNLMTDDAMVTPANGVYVTCCIVNGRRRPSVTNVGVRPTVGDFAKNMETHMLDFDGELYGKVIRVEFLKRMREERRFGGMDELAGQIKKDCMAAREFHRENFSCNANGNVIV